MKNNHLFYREQNTTELQRHWWHLSAMLSFVVTPRVKEVAQSFFKCAPVKSHSYLRTLAPRRRTRGDRRACSGPGGGELWGPCSSRSGQPSPNTTGSPNDTGLEDTNTHSDSKSSVSRILSEFKGGSFGSQAGPHDWQHAAGLQLRQHFNSLLNIKQMISDYDSHIKCCVSPDPTKQDSQQLAVSCLRRAHTHTHKQYFIF